MDAGCWVVGGEFEDSVFEERAERRRGPPAPYIAKRCEPQWFHEETEKSDDEVLTLKKFRGDLAYRRQDYQKALQEYSSIAERLSSTNLAVKRDVQEGQARCLAHLGRHGEALEIAADLGVTVTPAFSGKDHLAYFPEPGPESSASPREVSGSRSQQAEITPGNGPTRAAGEGAAGWTEAQVKACASLVRARLLLQFTQSQQISFALERNLRTQQEIEEQLKGFSLGEDTLQLITEVMGEDIIPEKIKDELHSEVKCVGPEALAALVPATLKEFEDKWFGKIKDHLCPSENQLHTQIQIVA
ncbi:uncharacterized protein C8orf76 homolog isoform X2 [Dipodomys spectabilis]|uniref:uncharacterized protein C8orf76 homolog isoform X2 n=1 Tax=Dipodomys spectabilis TaxID=105255 RepID=UPI001C53B627|nr:uncharacterized protein C8orf76 homolog isoform X2 [Dipodomys spectabilis]